MTKPFDPSVPFLDHGTARTHRQLRLVKALLKIDDPEVEQALIMIAERLVAAKQLTDTLPPRPPADARPEAPQA